MLEHLLYSFATPGPIDPENFDFTKAQLSAIVGPPGATGAGTFHQATEVLNNQMYSFGSYSGTGKTTCFRFNPSSGVNTVLTALPTSMYGASIVLHQGKFWLFGGTRGDASTDFIVYDPVANTFARETAPGLPLSMHTKVAYHDGKIYMPQVNNTTNYYIYDIPTKTLETISLASLGIANIFDRASIYADGYIYSFGGRSARVSTAVMSPVAYRMDIVTRQIELLPNMPTACFLGNNLFTNGKQIYLPGPIVGTSAVNKTMVYDIPTGQWSDKTAPGAMRAFSANAYITNRMYFLGGLVGGVEQPSGVRYASP